MPCCAAGAGTNLLDTYEVERKPVAIRNVSASTANLAPHAGDARA